MSIFVLIGLIVLAAAAAAWIVGERGHVLRPSTLATIRAGGIRRLFNLQDLHLYVYGRWITRYITILRRQYTPRLGEKGRRRLADHYHAKVITTEQARRIISVDRDIPLRDLEHIIPYATARELVLSAPADVVVFQCGCRESSPHPCEPVQVCMVIGKPFTDFVLEHHPRTSRRLSQTEALELLAAEHERGHMHTAWFKNACLDRFYAICNCCKCCCAGLEAMLRRGVPMMVSSGYVAEVDETLCDSCGSCELNCLFEAIEVNGHVSISWDACMGCGVCVGQCLTGALSLRRDVRKGEPLDVAALTGEARQEAISAGY